METIIEIGLIVSSNLIMGYLGYRMGKKMHEMPKHSAAGPFVSSSKVVKLRKPKIQSDEKAYWQERGEPQRWD